MKRTINITIENDAWDDSHFCYEVTGILRELAEDTDGLYAFRTFTTKKGTKVRFEHKAL